MKRKPSLWLLLLVAGSFIAGISSRATVSSLSRASTVSYGSDRTIALDQPRYLDVAQLDEGWQVPSLSRFTKSVAETVVTAGGAKVNKRMLKAPNEPLVTIDQFRLSQRGELIISRTPCYISDVISYSVSSKLFAYEVRGVVAIKQ